MSVIPGAIGAYDLASSSLVEVNMSSTTLTFPTSQDCITKLNIVAPVAPNTDLLNDITNILAAVIAEFQSPVGLGTDGCGTGRSFSAVTETRVFDGTGYAKLIVDDFDPTQPITVSAYGCLLSDVVVQQNRHGLGVNTIVRQMANGVSFFWMAQELPYGIFPVGEQNISVTATFGNAVTADIFHAIVGEVCYRALVAGYVDLAGVGETLTMGQYSNATASGISVWGQSSPIAVFHTQYKNCVVRYRDNGSWRRVRLVASMS